MKALGLVGLAIGAYLLYEWFQSQGAAVPVSSVPVASGNPTVTTNPPPSTSSTVVTTPIAMVTSHDPIANTPANITNAVLSAATAAGYPQTIASTFTFDQWAYFYNQIFVPLTATQSEWISSNFGIQNGTTQITIGTFVSMLASMQSAGISGLGEVRSLGPSGNKTSLQNAPYGVSIPGRPFTEGLGRVYLSGFGLIPHNNRDSYGFNPPMSGLGVIGQGFGINETFGGDASYYELASKYVM